MTPKALITNVILVSTISGFIRLNAQSNDKLHTDSLSNIESYSGELGIYLYGIQKYNKFELKLKDQEGKLEYSPNENINIGLGFNYNWMGLGVAFNFGFVNSDKELYGTTNSLDLQLDVYSRKFLINGNFQFYQGYYWNNPEDYFANWSIEDSAVIRPDIRTGTFGLSGVYIFNNENFSFKAAFQNTERQIKSAGSWLLGAKFSIYSIVADSSIVPAELHNLYQDSLNFGGVAAVNIGSAFGYAHTFVFKKYFYFTSALMIGINLQAVSAVDISGQAMGSDGKLSSNALFRLALGCNKPTHFYGFTVSADSFLVKDPNETEFSYNYGKIRLHYGRRFTIPKRK